MRLIKASVSKLCGGTTRVSDKKEFAAYISIDWADRMHEGRIQEVDSNRIESFQLLQRPDAIQEWVGCLRARFGRRKVALAVEQKRGALIYALMRYEMFVFFPVNTTAIKNYRKALRASGAKDDPCDADLLLDFLKNHYRWLRRWDPESIKSRQLTMLTEARRKLVDRRAALSNQITALLKEYYPAALGMIGVVKTRLACAFLSKWPNLRALKRAQPEEIRRLYYVHNCRSRQRINERLAKLTTAVPLVTDNQMISVYSLLLRSYVAQIKAVLKQIEIFDKKIEAIFDTHPDAGIYGSLPAAGTALKPRLAAALGEDRNKFENAVAVLNFSGVAPITRRSGKSKIVLFRFAAPTFVRQTWVEFARCSVRSSTWARADYLLYRAAGMSHQAAIRRIAYKWIRIVYRCWKDRVPYDETKFLQARESRAHRMRVS